MLSTQQIPYVLAGVFLMTLQPILVTLSQNEFGKTDYSAVSSTLMTETLKIGISCTLLFQSAEKFPTRIDTKEVLEYSVPALIYFINNNLVFVILQHIDATTFQLLSQLKTVFTGLLFRAFLGRKLAMYQYLAIWQLACGTSVSQLPGVETHARGPQETSVLGLALSVVSCLLSAFGGIYSEKLLKGKSKESIHWQNIQLYSWGILFNFLGVLILEGDSITKPTTTGSSLFSGYNGWAVSVVVNNALNGLAISAILKYADNIARVYAHACAMLVTMVLSVVLFDRRPTPQLLLSIGIVAASAVQYNAKAESLGISESSKPTQTASVEIAVRSPTVDNKEVALTARPHPGPATR